MLQEMEQSDAIYHLVIKYINKKTTEEETIHVLDWINSSQENKTLFFQLKDISDFSASNLDQSKDAKLVWEEMLYKNAAPNAEKKITRKKKPFLGFLHYAAAALIVCAGIFSYRQYIEAQTITISVALNQSIQKINLPDHSVIWLKPGSTINYKEKFANRVVNLKGDGFFEVTKLLDETGKRKSFTVMTPKLEVSVLGTSFNVKDNLQQQDVVVKTGTVKVQNQAQLKILHPGDRVQLLKGELIVDQINANLFMGWTNGGYKFENTGIKEIQQLLELSYNCKVVISHPEKFKNVNLSGWVAATNEKDFLSILQIMLSAIIIKQNNLITITTIAYD